jgi:hypothetical protein
MQKSAGPHRMVTAIKWGKKNNEKGAPICIIVCVLDSSLYMTLFRHRD